jgi:hypothetical protein
MKRSCTCVVVGVFIFSLFMGSLVYIEKAFAGINDACIDNPKTCTNCQCKILAFGNKVTAATVSAILNCSKDKRCNVPTGSKWNAKNDLNNDNVVNNKDYNIARKCLGCRAQKSPFK